MYKCNDKEVEELTHQLEKIKNSYKEDNLVRELIEYYIYLIKKLSELDFDDINGSDIYMWVREQVCKGNIILHQGNHFKHPVYKKVNHAD